MIFKEYFNQNAELADFFAKKFNISSKIMRIILSRGMDSEDKINEFLHPSVCHDPFSLKGMRELKDRVFVAKELKDRVLVFGDYDVDGVSATAIMLKTLKLLGIDADFYLPNRYVDGYGLTCEVIDKIIKKFNPQLIITVDCGISCYKEVEYAKNKGIDVIITDHHEIPEILPDTIVLNAKIKGQDYPFDGLCGTGMAYKVSQALIGEKEAEQFLPIAAIATIADIVPLLDENRTIVTKGLSLFDRFLPYGIKSLIKDCKLSVSNISSTDISFKLSPKINASGRMGDAADSLNLYMENDPVKIKHYIERIKLHNQKRQELCNKIFEDAEKALKKVNLRDQRVISLASKAWDQGVLGIVCSRLVEKYHKPVFLFAQVGDELHGSGRSIDDINIHELLSSLKDILDTFGGHSMAAGLTLKRNNYEEFVKRVNSFVFEKVDDKVFIPITYYDEQIRIEEIDDKFLNDLKLLEPVGCSNPRPKFKITTNDLQLQPMKKYPQHANIKIGGLDLLFFNIQDDYNKMLLSRQKSFIFEFQGFDKKGVVSYFDGGSFIGENINQFVQPFEIEELKYEKDGTATYKLYSKKDLLEFVAKTHSSVFGTCFVTFSAYNYVNFVKTYSLQGIFNFGVADYESSPYNSVLLSPIGVDWVKNYAKIVFLDPVLEEGFIAKLNKLTDAEIYLPIDKKLDLKRFEKLDLSRAKFGSIFSKVATKVNKLYNSIFELYNDCYEKNEVSFFEFYSAILTFNELNVLKLTKGDLIKIEVDRSSKRALTDSVIYNKLSLLKEVLKEGTSE